MSTTEVALISIGCSTAVLVLGACALVGFALWATRDVRLLMDDGSNDHLEEPTEDRRRG